VSRTISRVLVCALAFALSAAPVVARAAEPDWLVRVNELRAAASLPSVAESATLSAGCYLHARYMAMNGVIGHDEDPALPYYSAAGNAAAGQSNVALGAGGVAAVDLWARGPFHALGLIDPRLVTAGFGTYANPGGWSAAALNILGGRSSTLPAGTTFPILWPGPGKTTGLLSYAGGESPDPLTGTGFSVPSGPPIIVQFGSGAGTPVVTASSFSRDGAALEHAVYTEATYTNANASHQSLGRSVLGTRDAVVLIPKAPLIEGARYDVSLTVNGSVYAWSIGGGDGAVSVTLEAPGSCDYSSVTTVTATLRAADDTTLTGRLVRFESSHDGATWATFAEGVTGESGSACATLAPITRTYVRAVFGGDETFPQAMSAATSIRPAALVGAPRVPRYERVRRSYTATGVLEPAHVAGASALVVDAQRWESGRWVTRRKFTARAYGTPEAHGYRVTVTLPYRGTWRVRARHIADPTNGGAVSAWRKVIVRS